MERPAYNLAQLCGVDLINLTWGWRISNEKQPLRNKEVSMVANSVQMPIANSSEFEDDVKTSLFNFFWFQ